MKKHLISLFVVFVSFGSFAQEKDYAEAFKLVDVWLEAQKDYDGLPAITALALEDQKVIWSGAYGEASPGNPASNRTLFSICSISKLFTSVAVMKLYDEGKLRLDDRIEDVLPWYNLPQQYDGSGPVTIRSLLTHSSGLPREANAPYWSAPDFNFPSQEMVRKELKNQATLYPASTYFQYSNLGLTLLGEVVEEISGMKYQEYVTQNILDPLQLSDTRAEMPEALYGNQLAYGYSAMTRKREREKVPLFDAKGITAAAGFSSSVEDLGQFAAWQFRLLGTPKDESGGQEILKPATLRNMQRVHWMDPDFGTTRGLGFGVYKDEDGSRMVGHGGSCPGYRTKLSLYPADTMAFVAMVNANGVNPQNYIDGIRTIISKAKAVDEPEEVPPVNLTAYTGFYSVQPWGGENYVGQVNNRLVIMNMPDMTPSITVLTHEGGDVFRLTRDNGEPAHTITFLRNDEGEVVSMKQHTSVSRKMENNVPIADR